MKMELYRKYFLKPAFLLGFEDAPCHELWGWILVAPHTAGWTHFFRKLPPLLLGPLWPAGSGASLALRASGALSPAPSPACTAAPHLEARSCFPFSACASCISRSCRSLDTSGSSSLPTSSSGCPLNASGLMSFLSPGPNPKPRGSDALLPHPRLPPPLPAPHSALDGPSILPLLSLSPPSPASPAQLLPQALVLHMAASVVLFKPVAARRGFVQTIWWLPGVVLSRHRSDLTVAPHNPRPSQRPGVARIVALCCRVYSRYPGVFQPSVVLTGPRLTCLPQNSVVLGPNSVAAHLLQRGIDRYP
ncbi:uncharacterized protein LOC115945037 [Leptonychotes weddellii]|uniref:Uncharacterized protein LOC115945037 n=1 Tax=Leptonychotes weddellii TaxID=9713 RepID=A0A7F8RWB7_LEPWE|nr:uncharacterized protein LOC115945037 [Leptonychotes weddellii]